MNIRNLSVLSLLVSTAVLGSGCEGYYLFMGTNAIKGISQLEIRGHVKKGGKPYANRAFTFTSTNYFANLAANQTLNAGVQTNAAGTFSLDATTILCSARPDFTEFSKTISETDSSWSSDSTAVVLGLINWVGSDGKQRQVHKQFSTSLIPRSICHNYDPSRNEFALEYEIPKFEKHADDINGLIPQLNAEVERVLNKHDDEKFRSKVRSTITPIEVGIININNSAEKTNGRIRSINLELIEDLSDADSSDLKQTKNRSSRYEMRNDKAVSFVVDSDPKTGKATPQYGWAFGRLFKLIVDIEFDMDEPTEEAPGMIASSKPARDPHSRDGRVDAESRDVAEKGSARPVESKQQAGSVSRAI